MALRNIDQHGVSVVLCCYNSKNRIIPTLQHLQQQRDISFPWEVVLIDNNSSDNTGEIAVSTWAANAPCELRLIREPQPGTMVARRRGINEANFRYLLFCDDDNWLFPFYIKKAFEIITRSPAIAAVGGMGILEFEDGFVAPGWIKNYQQSLGAGPQGKDNGDTTYGKGCLYTAGTILDRAWLDQLYSMGFQSSLKGRDGKSLVAGEDTELTYALKLIGGKLYYSSDLVFRHYMPGGRISWAYLLRMWESFGYSDFLISPYKMHFRRVKNRGYLVHILITFLSLGRFALLANLDFFSEGSKRVLKFFKTVGQLKAILFSYGIFLQNCAMVEDLVSKSTNKVRP